MIDPIKKIILKHPKTAFINQKKINKEFNTLNFTEAPDFNESLNEYDSFIKILDSFGIDKYFLEKNDSTSIDSIYTHDPLVITNKGVVLCNMGKVNRISESKAIKEFLIELKIPILGEITSPGKLEGGDIVWINKRTIAVGTGYRTNNEGIEQLKQILNQPKFYHRSQNYPSKRYQLQYPLEYSAVSALHFPSVDSRRQALCAYRSHI